MINESPLVHDYNFKKESIDSLVRSVNIKKAPSHSFDLDNITYDIYEKGKTVFVIGYKMKMMKVSYNAVLYLEAKKSHKDFIQPVMLYVDPSARGGVAVKLYTRLIGIYGGMISDYSISRPMLTVYNKLMQSFNAYYINREGVILEKIDKLDGVKSMRILVTDKEML